MIAAECQICNGTCKAFGGKSLAASGAHSVRSPSTWLSHGNSNGVNGVEIANKSTYSMEAYLCVCV